MPSRNAFPSVSVARPALTDGSDGVRRVRVERHERHSFPSVDPMTVRIAMLGLFALLGCHGSTSPQDDPMVVVDGPLTLSISDFPTQMGVLWIAPNADGGRGAVTAHATRYGSLCSLAVTGHAEVSGSRVLLHIAYMPRTTLCIAEVRALRYDAAIGGLAPGRYEVHIFHAEGDGRPETEVQVQTVDVT
jgi:hypothetical protein